MVRALAEYAIEHQFGIKSSTTVYREHLYELEGFRAIFGAERVNAIKASGSISEADWPALPRLSVRLALHELYAPLENLIARIVEVADGRAVVHCTSDDHLTEIMIGLNFRKERLEIDIQDGIAARDDGSETAARQGATVMRFCLDYIMNGILEVWDAESIRLLGRCDAFLPVNVDMQATHRNFQENIRRIEAEADRRAIDATTDKDS